MDRAVIDRLAKLWSSQVDVASIAVFRIVYGLLAFGLSLGFLVSGYVDEYARTCDVQLQWYGLEWIALPCDPVALKILVGFTVLASAGVTLGFMYRVSAILLELAFVYTLLADQAIYSSTYYLLCLFGFWLIFAPADRAWSIDAKRRGYGRTGPAWPLVMLGFHTVQMYVYAAIAKLDGDWLRGLPLERWFEQRADLPLLGPALQMPGMPVVFAWGGLFFDALIVPAILYDKTRKWALVATVAFHAFNGLILEVFPLPITGAAATLLLLRPDWPRRVLARFRGQDYAVDPHRPVAKLPRALVISLGVWVILHLLVPFRHHIYPGPVAWNEDGDEFSWRLRARTKNKSLRIWVEDLETGEREQVRVESRLNRIQRVAIRTYPDRLLQFAHQLAEEARLEGREVSVRVRYRVGLNRRPKRDLVSERLDLALQPRTFLNTDWVEPFAE